MPNILALDDDIFLGSQRDPHKLRIPRPMFAASVYFFRFYHPDTFFGAKLYSLEQLHRLGDICCEEFMDKMVDIVQEILVDSVSASHRCCIRGLCQLIRGDVPEEDDVVQYLTEHWNNTWLSFIRVHIENEEETEILLKGLSYVFAYILTSSLKTGWQVEATLAFLQSMLGNYAFHRVIWVTHHDQFINAMCYLTNEQTKSLLEFECQV